MANADRELEKKLQQDIRDMFKLEAQRNELNFALSGFERGDMTVQDYEDDLSLAISRYVYRDLMPGLVKQQSLALLDRIKEEGPEDMIAHTKDGGQPRLYYRQVGFNSSNKTWRTTIDNIAKEIRGEK